MLLSLAENRGRSTVTDIISTLASGDNTRCALESIKGNCNDDDNFTPLSIPIAFSFTLFQAPLQLSLLIFLPLSFSNSLSPTHPCFFVW